MSRDIKYKITADNTEFKEGVEQVRTITEGIEDPFKALGDVLEETNSKFLGMVSGATSGIAALGGLSLGVEALVDHLKEVTEQVTAFKHLATETGVSAETISDWTNAAIIAEVPADKWQQALVHLSEHMVKAREEGGPMLEMFERLGITQEDLAKGDIQEILIKISEAYAASADDAFKLQVNTALFGGKLAELLPLLDKFKEKVDEGRQSSLHMSQENIEQVARMGERWHTLWVATKGMWKDGAIIAGEQMDAMERQALLVRGVFSDLATTIRSAFGSIPGLSGFRSAQTAPFSGMVSATATAPEPPKESAEDNKGTKPSLGDNLPQFEALKKQLRRQEEEEGVSFEARLGYERRFWQGKLAAAQAGGEKYKETAAQIREAMLQLDEKSAKDKTRFNEWDRAIQDQQTAFEIEQAQQGTFQKFSVQATADYWKQILDRDDLSTAERLEVGRKWLGAQNQIVKIAQEKSDQLKKIEEDRIAFVQKEGLAEIEFEKRLAEMDEQQGLIDKSELLRQTQDFENRKFEIERQALQQKLALAQGENGGNKDLAAANQLNLQIEELERQHQRNMAVIDREGANERLAPFRNMVTGMESTWSHGLVQMMNGQLRFSNAMKGMWNSLVQGFEQMAADMVMHWAAKELMQTVATATGATERVAIEEASKEQSIAISIAMGIKDVAISAYKAIAAAWSSISAIPYVGPFLAPAVALATGAAIFAIGSQIASAEGGYDIPAGVNPLTQLHAREMVLPAPVADTVRSAMGGGGGATSQSYHYHAAPGETAHSIASNEAAAV